jgi:hypothetical protein
VGFGMVVDLLRVPLRSLLLQRVARVPELAGV